MRRLKRSEKTYLDEVFFGAQRLNDSQKCLSIGQLLALTRNRLSMSQSQLAARAGVPQSTISRIESGRLEPNVMTLRKIFDAMSCDLLISAFPRVDVDHVVREQARKKAERTVRYLQGTMALEKQEPDSKFLEELIEEEMQRLLNNNRRELWSE